MTDVETLKTHGRTHAMEASSGVSNPQRVQATARSRLKRQCAPPPTAGRAGAPSSMMYWMKPPIISCQV